MARGATVAAKRPEARRTPAHRSRTGLGRSAPRRVSGPTRTRLSGGGAAVALPARVLGAPFARVARARGSSFLDALLRGRVWIGLVGLLLVGIVFFNVDLLRLNREIAHTTEKSTALKRENGRLLLDVARLDSSERLQEAAARRGFILPAPNDVRYLRARPRRDARDAARRMTAADAEGGALAGVVPTPPAPTQPQGAAGQPPGAAAQPQASPAQPPGTGTGQPSGAGQAQSAAPGATQPQTPAATQPQVTQPGLGAGGPAG